MWYLRPLDWLNFFLADVRGGLGPYVGVFLLTQADWNQATIGAVLTVSGLIGITLHTPIGALIDATHFKRGLIIGGTCGLAISAVAIAWAPTLPIVLTADILMAVAGAIFAPSERSIRSGRQHFHRRARWRGWLGLLTACNLLSRAAFCRSHKPRRSVDPRPFDRP